MDKVHKRYKFKLKKVYSSELEFDRKIPFTTSALSYYVKGKVKKDGYTIDIRDQKLCKGLTEIKKAMIFNNEKDSYGALYNGVVLNTSVIGGIVAKSCDIKFNEKLGGRNYGGVRYNVRTQDSNNFKIPKSQVPFFKEMVGKTFIITPLSDRFALIIALVAVVGLLYSMSGKIGKERVGKVRKGLKEARKFKKETKALVKDVKEIRELIKKVK